MRVWFQDLVSHVATKKVANVERTYMQVVFENCIFEIEDEMSAELLLCTGVKVQDVTCFTHDSINFRQLVTNILQMQKI